MRFHHIETFWNFPTFLAIFKENSDAIIQVAIYAKNAIFEHDLPTKEPLAKELCKCSQQVNEIPSNLQGKGDHNNKMPRMIDSYRLGFDCRSSLQKIGYHHNIEKYCLNLNPYSSK